MSRTVIVNDKKTVYPETVFVKLTRLYFGYTLIELVMISVRLTPFDSRPITISLKRFSI